jgi:hypothetical protein
MIVDSLRAAHKKTCPSINWRFLNCNTRKKAHFEYRGFESPPGCKALGIINTLFVTYIISVVVVVDLRKINFKSRTLIFKIWKRSITQKTQNSILKAKYLLSQSIEKIY